MRLLKFSVLLFLAALLCLAGTRYTTGTPNEYFIGVIPATSEMVVSGTVYVQAIVLSNKSAATVTVTIYDRSADCSGPCELFPTVSIAANTTYVIPLYGAVAPAGITWVASAGSAVVGRVHYRTSMREP